jgi:SAM-dependent methyltransferase
MGHIEIQKKCSAKNLGLFMERLQELLYDEKSQLRCFLIESKIIRIFKSVSWPLRTIWAKSIKTRLNLLKNRKKSDRLLEIGPGHQRILDFETADILTRKDIDYVIDCSKKLPFKDSTYDIVYASHVLEHIAWYQVDKVLQEWVIILKPGGYLELWVPDAVKICKAFIDAEVRNNNYIDMDGWYKFNSDKDPCVWASGRIYTYGDGNGDPKSPNWHKALFSERYLSLLMSKVGLTDIAKLDRNEIRSDDHGWINLGLRGKKPYNF